MNHPNFPQQIRREPTVYPRRWEFNDAERHDLKLALHNRIQILQDRIDATTPHQHHVSAGFHMSLEDERDRVQALFSKLAGSEWSPEWLIQDKL